MNPRAAFVRSLDEALRWSCQRFSMFDLEGSLRSPELRPLGDLFDSDRAVHVVQDVIERRRLLVNANPERYQRGGLGPLDHLGPHSTFATRELVLQRADRAPQVRNVVAVYPSESLSDGTSPPCTGGFVDMDDLPPWDSWVTFDGDMLVALVPRELVSAVECAIDCNAYNCIGWLGYRDHPLINVLRGPLGASDR